MKIPSMDSSKLKLGGSVVEHFGYHVWSWMHDLVYG
jgi:hypothetical protein